jgi:hypothetical protein
MTIAQADWKQWLADNMLRGVPPEHLREVLVREGLKPGPVQHELNALQSHPAMRAAQRYVHAVRRVHSLQQRQERLASYAPGPTTIERRAGVTREEFYRRYVATGTPVVLTDATAGWPAWTPADLRAKVGDTRVQVMLGRDSDPRYQQNQDQHMVEMAFDRYVDLVERAGVTNDFYMVARNRNLEKLEPLLAELKPVPAVMAPDSPPSSYLLWFGPAGTRTPAHHDPNGLLFCQVYGRKRFWLVKPDELSLILGEEGYYAAIDLANPDLARFPDFAGAKVHQLEVGPGDALFLPVGWWHQVLALDPSISVTLDQFLRPEDL